MTDQELIQFATEFRAGLLGNRSSHRCCFVVCSPLATLLGLHGVEVELVESDLGKGRNHAWLRLADGRALDPTADQFGGYPPVYLGPPKKIHRTARAQPDGTRLTVEGAEIVAAAVEWLGEPDRRKAANARARFKRKVDKATAADPLASMGLWMEAVGTARAVIAGDIVIDAPKTVSSLP